MFNHLPLEQAVVTPCASIWEGRMTLPPADSAPNSSLSPSNKPVTAEQYFERYWAIKPEEWVKIVAGGRVCRGNRWVRRDNSDGWGFLNDNRSRNDWRDGDIIVTQVVQQGVKETLTKQLGEKEVAIVE